MRQDIASEIDTEFSSKHDRHQLLRKWKRLGERISTSIWLRPLVVSLEPLDLMNESIPPAVRSRTMLSEGAVFPTYRCRESEDSRSQQTRNEYVIGLLS